VHHEAKVGTDRNHVIVRVRGSITRTIKVTF